MKALLLDELAHLARAALRCDGAGTA